MRIFIVLGWAESEVMYVLIKPVSTGQLLSCTIALLVTITSKAPSISKTLLSSIILSNLLIEPLDQSHIVPPH
jgi:hypothetical protein